MDLDSLAALAGNTLVTTAVTDTFETMRHRVARIFGRGKPDTGTERRLDATRQQLTGTAPGALERVQAAQTAQWQTRFADLLADHPKAATELRALLAELQSTVPEVGGAVTNTISGSMVNGPVLMGRDFGDITINPPPHSVPDE
jgi:hypothetical protein